MPWSRRKYRIRLYENIANGSGLDISMMGDMRGYEDERNYDVIKTVYAYHKKHEPYFGKYKSVANIAVIAPGSWPSGPTDAGISRNCFDAERSAYSI